MTRDEAVKVMGKIWGGNPQHDLANSYVDAFVALGMLKLDEPKDSQQLLIGDMASYVSVSAAVFLRDELAQRGLKICEK